MEKTKKIPGSFLVILAGIFWGSMGLFVRLLEKFGLTSIQVACLRFTLAGIIFVILCLATEPKSLLIKLKDLPLFLGLGLVSILMFSCCYFAAMGMMSLSAAAILLYTSPIWVMLMSCIFFKEKLTVQKAAALICAFAGCMMVSGIGGGAGIRPVGIVIGLCSGLCYGLYSILGSIALKKYSPLTVTTYGIGIAAIGSWFICAPQKMLGTILAVPNKGSLMLIIVAAAVFTAVIPFTAYTLGLKTTSPSKAAILATVEPMVATLLGSMVFSEPLTISAITGIVMIILSIVLLNIKLKKGLNA